MSIPHICPSCGNHISTAHAEDCCYGTPQYAHIGWPDMATAMTNFPNITQCINEDSSSILTMGDDTASAIRRLLEYLEEEPELAPEAPTTARPDALALLTTRAEELRKEAAGIYNVEARAKRTFAVDVLDGIIQELSE